MREEDFKLGRAFLILNRYSCADCKEVQIASLSPEERDQYEKSLTPKEPMPVPKVEEKKDRFGSSSTRLKPLPPSVTAATPPPPPSRRPESNAPGVESTPAKTPAPEPSPPPVRSRTEPIPKPGSGLFPARKTPPPRPGRRPGQTSRPYGTGARKKGAPNVLLIGIIAVVVLLVIILVIVLSQQKGNPRTHSARAIAANPAKACSPAPVML